MQHTQSDVLRTATLDYLAAIDPQNPPPPAQIEFELLKETQSMYENENQSLTKGNKWKLPNRLTPWHVAQILMTVCNVRKIACAGLSGDTTYDLICIYREDGPDKGIYVTDEDEMRRMARQYDISMTTREFTEMLSYLRDNSKRVTMCADPDLIAVNNGIFNYRTKQLMDFTPDLVFMTKSRVNYVKNAVSPVIHNQDDGTDWDVESWMHTLSDDDEIVGLLWEILGAIIRPHVPWNKSAWFYSEKGNNGKGTLCELMRQLCGDGSYAAIKLDDMGKDFALEPLIRASAVIVDENDVGTFIDKAANLKAIITGDVIQINRKFKIPIPYKFRGFMVQCLNEMPRIKDKSDSFYRRQLFIPFEKCFTGVERKYIKDDYLHRREVLEYVLHKVLNTDYYDLSEPEACKSALEEYKEFNDPVRQFANEVLPECKWSLLPIGFLFDLYKKWYKRNFEKESGTSNITFSRSIRMCLENNPAYKVETDNEGKIKQYSPGDMMDIGEPMIDEYELKAWMNSYYAGDPDINKRCVPVLKKQYRGIIKVNNDIQNPLDDSQDDD